MLYLELVCVVCLTVLPVPVLVRVVRVLAVPLPVVLVLLCFVRLTVDWFVMVFFWMTEL